MPYFIRFLQLGPSIFDCLCDFLAETMPKNFQGYEQGRFGDSKKDRCFLKIATWQHKFIRKQKREKLVSSFLKNVGKTCS